MNATESEKAPAANFRQRLLAQTPSIGVVATLADPSVVEILVQAGYDWLWIDAEHSPLNPTDIQKMAQAAGGCPCLVRVPGLEEGWVKKVLDTGVDGIIFPLINSGEEARRAVALCRYPPLGRRSMGIGRAQRYGHGFEEYVAQANEQVCVVVQIEHIEGVQRVTEILDTPGVDALLIGPYDLSNSMGKPGQVEHPQVKAAIESVRHACLAFDKPLGVFTTSVDYARRALKDGFTFVAVGIDVMLLANAARQTVQQVKSGGV
jgi:2-dehydro-3-deoxyglucarate aldolase/4-hydroxy-2-oxoheptanedioate aldolase